MHPTVIMRLSDALSTTALKDMDGTLLSSFVRRESAARGMQPHRIDLALDVMAYCHRSQTRMNRGPHSTTAYAEHPARVAARLLRWGVKQESMIVAALLHDAVEDAPRDLAWMLGALPDRGGDLREPLGSAMNADFGFPVGDLVLALSNPLMRDGLTAEQRNARYRLHVESAIQEKRVAIVKACDLVDNAGALHHLLVRGENVAPAQKRARKYAPLLPIVAERCMADDVAALLTAEGHRAMLGSLANTIRRVEAIADGHTDPETLPGVTRP